MYQRDLDFDISTSINVRPDRAIGLPIYDFLAVFNNKI